MDRLTEATNALGVTFRPGDKFRLLPLPSDYTISEIVRRNESVLVVITSPGPLTVDINDIVPAFNVGDKVKAADDLCWIPFSADEKESPIPKGKEGVITSIEDDWPIVDFGTVSCPVSLTEIEPVRQ